MELTNIMLDTLTKIDSPIRVILVGNGYIARGVAHQISKFTRGMTIVGICGRDLDKTNKICNEFKLTDCVVSDNLSSVIQSCNADIVVELTGDVSYGTDVVVESIDNKLHVLTMSSELDSTLGWVLQGMARKAGVVYSNCGGDQPGEIMNLKRYVEELGLTPLVLGNIKRFQDVIKNPDDMVEWADRVGQKASMITSFTDGTKIAMEMACVGNATGFTVDSTGMSGRFVEDAMDAHTVYDVGELLKSGGIVDYLIGDVHPSGGVYVVGHTEDKLQQEYLKYYKMGDGPLYTFVQNYHLCHFDVVSSIVRVVMFDDPVVVSKDKPTLEVMTIAKRDLPVGTVLDGIGGFDCYGVVDTSDNIRYIDGLPMGLSGGCTTKRLINQGEIIECSMVKFPSHRLCDVIYC